ncbi:MAG: hypothetical protein IPL79_10395 [Myxococcales bacterium]|nr:hypothetical protein [Myxococcales bacterium]
MKALLLLMATLVTATNALAGSIRIENGDSKAYTIKLNCSGSKSSFEVRASTTATYTFHSTHTSCKLDGGDVAFPNAELKDGEKYKIKDATAKAN